MPIQILMPALSPTMTEGNLAKWTKREGDTIKPGDVIAEIETDKATMEVEAVDEGVLGKILVPAGTQKVAVNTPIAVLLGEGEKPGAPVAAAPAPVKPPTAALGAAPNAPAPVAAPAPAALAAPSGERLFVSPLARRMAEQAGLDLKAVRGSGPQGRIVKADVEAALAGPRPVAAPVPVRAAAAPAPASAPLQVHGMPDFVDQPLGNMRRTIARRMVESKSQVPHHYLTVDCEIDRLLAMRKELNEKSDTKISVNDMVIKALALALMKVPDANVAFTGEAIRRYRWVDVSVAVAIEGGLITPILREADRKGLARIAAEMKDLAERARAGKLKLDEFQGGTTSLSNLGMMGIKQFAAVVNPPQGTILAVGAGEARPVVKQNALAIATVMTCTLSCDHRAVDGAVGASLLAAFKALIEDPIRMLL
ncbi:MAG: pyruvate dehydrogenase complex dihydrolipoamide acetyltransferase [Alphaproteobacteria bacterium]|nr:pyruvate dehydrogenase complex dihydrolipoamide acetyltransferase [Alphaproteobacteria bacterium]